MIDKSKVQIGLDAQYDEDGKLISNQIPEKEPENDKK